MIKYTMNDIKIQLKSAEKTSNLFLYLSLLLD